LRWLPRKAGVFITWTSSQQEEVYVHQPPRFAIPGKESKVLRLRKALYGLW
jgi:hypothetical protein